MRCSREKWQLPVRGFARLSSGFWLAGPRAGMGRIGLTPRGAGSQAPGLKLLGFFPPGGKQTRTGANGAYLLSAGRFLSYSSGPLSSPRIQREGAEPTWVCLLAAPAPHPCGPRGSWRPACPIPKSCPTAWSFPSPGRQDRAGPCSGGSKLAGCKEAKRGYSPELLVKRDRERSITWAQPQIGWQGREWGRKTHTGEPSSEFRGRACFVG